MIFSGSSLANALFLCSVMLALICLLNSFTPILEQGGSSVIILASILAAFRLILPFEIPITVVWSVDWLGAVQLFIRTYWPITYILVAIWAVGAGRSVKNDVRSLRLLYQYYGKMKTVESERTQRNADKLGITYPIKVSRSIDSPCVLGILGRYTIYMPYPEFSDEDTKMALLHERQHIKGHDAELKLFLGLLSSVVWWNRLNGSFQKMIDTALEFTCDRRTTKRMTVEEKNAYVTALGNVALRAKKKRRTAALALNEFYAVSGEDKILEQRINAIINDHKKKTPWYTGAVAKCLVVAVFMASYLVIVQPAGAPATDVFQNDSENYYIEEYYDPEILDEPSSVFILKGPDGRYQLFINYEFSRYLTEDEIASGKYKDSYVFEEDRQR